MLTLRRTIWMYSIPGIIALAGIGLKIFQWYHSRPTWLDEQMVFLNIRDRTFSQLAGPLWLDQTAPVGWLALQRTVLQLFGTTDRAVRALSVLFGIATLICAVWVGMRWMKPLGAALFVLLCGLTEWMTYYALEAKPYAGDAFWALLLPALVVWATEAVEGQSSVTIRRSLVWWLAATVGQWISYGAIFVAPGCAVLLCAVAWRANGPRRALDVGLLGLPWLASFAVHYYLVMRHARASSFLADFWSSGMPPLDSTAAGVLAWLAQQAQPLAFHPGGTTLGLSFWAAAACGLIISFRSRPILVISWLMVVVSACVFAIVGLVPLKDRLALWIVPALYASIALAADGSFDYTRMAVTRRSLPALAVALVAALLVWPLSTEMVRRGRENLLLRPVENHGFNDRAAMRYLMIQRRPGDVLIATHFGLPAVWWYGGIDIGDPNAGRRYPGDGSRVFNLTHHWPDSQLCRPVEGKTQPQRTLAGASRAALFLGFDSRIPPGLQELTLNTFNDFSRLVSFKLIANEGAVAIFDLKSPPEPDTTSARGRWRQETSPELPGCVVLLPARRW